MYVLLIHNFVPGCDYQHGPYSVVFNGGNQKSGIQRVTFRVNITDDDVYEEDESFNLVIDHSLPNRIHYCDPYRSMVTITSDERRKKYILVLQYVSTDKQLIYIP